VADLHRQFGLDSETIVDRGGLIDDIEQLTASASIVGSRPESER
jgi:hypothetical protein